MTTKRNPVLIPSAALFCCLVVSSLLCASPWSQFSPNTLDGEFFEPGGLMLLETFRLHRSDLTARLAQSGLLVLLCQGAILAARARLYWAAGLGSGLAIHQLRSVRTRFPFFAGLSLVSWLPAGAFVWFCAMGIRRAFDHWVQSGTSLVFATWIGLLLASAVTFLVLTTFIDCARFALFLRTSSPQLVGATMKAHAATLLGGRALRHLWTAAHALVILGMGTKDHSPIGTMALTLVALAATTFADTLWVRWVAGAFVRMGPSLARD